MISSNTLQLYNDKLGDFPEITFEYDVELLDLTITSTHEVYVLVRRVIDSARVLFNLEEAFLEPHLLLGTRHAVLVGNSIYMIDQNILWGCELGTCKWKFVKQLAKGDLLISGANNGPWGCMPDICYAIINGRNLSLDMGANLVFDDLVRGVAILPGGIFVFAGNSIFTGTDRLCDAPAKTKTIYVRGENVYVKTEHETFIFSEDAVSRYRNPRVQLCL